MSRRASALRFLIGLCGNIAHLCLGLRENIAHLIAEKVLRPVLDIAELVNFQTLQFGRRIIDIGEVGRYFVSRQPALGNSPLQSPQKMLGVGFDDQLDIPVGFVA